MKFELQFAIKIEPQSVLASFTRWVLSLTMVKVRQIPFRRLYPS
jgi:hypothetical protein